MADDVKLLAVIDANTKAFENALKRIERQTNQTFSRADQSVRRLESSLGSSAASMVRFGRTIATAFGAGVIAGGLATLPSVIRGVVKSMADLGDTADKIGITTDRLQELNFQATQTGSTAEQMTSALEQFAKRVGEAAQKGGDLAKIFEANNIALKNADGTLRPINDLLKDYSNLIKGAVSPSDQFVLATEAFGRGAGADMVLTLREGADGMARYGQIAHETGQILRNDLVRHAQEVDDKFDQLAGTLATFAQEQVLIFVRDLGRAFADLSGWLQAVRDQANAGAEALSNLGGANDVVALKEQLKEAEEILAGIQARAAKGIIIPGGSLDDAIALVQRLRREVAALTAEGAAATSANQTIKEQRQKDDRIITPTVLPPPPPKKTPRDRGASDLERQRKAVIELIAELQRELSLVGKSDTEQRISNELRQAGSEATTKQRDAIVALITQIESQREAEEQLIDTLDGIRNAAGGALDAFAQSIQDGEGATAGLKAALVDVLQTIIRIGEQQAISSLFGASGGTGGGLFGSIVSGLLGAATGGGGPALGSLSAASASVTGGRTGAPVIQLSVVPGQMFEPVVERISGNVSVRHAASAETRAVARTPASARDNQRRFAIP